MNGRPRQSYRAGRSGWYSAAKLTNWIEFDPYEEEISTALSSARPTCSITLPGDTECAIYERPLHAAFVRPFTTNDVVRVLTSLPAHCLRGLQAVYLMGGAAKQARVAFSSRFRYGSYGGSTIWLFAFPRRHMEWRRKELPPPHIMQEYERAGMVYEFSEGEWTRRFTEDSLRRFYLSDVLIHEVGHHVDRLSLLKKPDRDGERFAHWFVREYGPTTRRLLEQEGP